MAVQNKHVAWLALAAIAGAMLLAAIPSSAQTEIRFGGTSNRGVGFGCNDNDRCSFLNISEGKVGGRTTAFLVYDMSWFIDPVFYDLFGNGEIPVTDVQFVAQTATSLSVDTSTVPGFYSALCFYDNSTQEFGCSPQFPVVTMNLHSTPQIFEQGTFTLTSTFLNNRVHEEGTFNGKSATGTASIADQSFSNLTAFIETGQGQTISVTTGR